LARYDSRGQQLEWRARQELSRIAAEQTVAQAAIEAAEGAETYALERTLANGEQLARQTIGGMARINQRIRDVSQLDPDLEFACRQVAEVFAMAAARQVARYMERPR
jgi:hypothetical protein